MKYELLLSNKINIEINIVKLFNIFCVFIIYKRLCKYRKNIGILREYMIFIFSRKEKVGDKSNYDVIENGIYVIRDIIIC